MTVFYLSFKLMAVFLTHNTICFTIKMKTKILIVYHGQVWLSYSMVKDSRGVRTQACDCKRDRLWVRSLLKEIKHLIFVCLTPLNMQCQIQNSVKSGDRNVLILPPFAYSATCGIEREAEIPRVLYYFCYTFHNTFSRANNT